ncbi:9671_t:CDS:10 [Cetraspora pellucida]|uniref:9671_t:CDS:1 n=1 Tax=Cetraspora pellucida TaxID=1433469 RepID=A0A9N8ZCR7_9GLOM|nr:9671_t:CDS:10 [Cetraspora pellucida]
MIYNTSAGFYKPNEECETCLAHRHETYRQKKVNKTKEQKANARNKNTSNKRRIHALINSSEVTENLENILSHNYKLLFDFCNAINDLKNELCSVCNERFPSIELYEEECCYCHYKKNIDIDNNILQSLPENGSIIDQLSQLLDDETNHKGLSEENIDSYEDKTIENGFSSQTFVPSMPPGFDWPYIETSPIDEFHTLRYMAQAFPTLFSQGISICSSFMMTLFCIKYTNEMKALSEGWVFVQQNLEDDVADLHWPNLHKLMPSEENSVKGETNQEASKCRHKDLIENPHIAAWYFEKCFKIFFEKVLIPKWGLEKISNNQEKMEEVVLNKALYDNIPDNPALKAFQKLFLYTVAEQDYSAQETCHLLLQMLLYHCSRNFVILNLNKEVNRLLCDSDKHEDRKTEINSAPSNLIGLAVKNIEDYNEDSESESEDQNSVAAFNIQGSIIYSTFSVPITSNNFDLIGNRLKKLQNKLQRVKYIIIDEIIGDFGQLPPICDLLMYSKDTSIHQILYLKMDAMLTVNFRKYINSRLYSDSLPVVKICAVHTGGSEASKANSDVTKGLDPVLLLARKAYIMLNTNL